MKTRTVFLSLLVFSVLMVCLQTKVTFAAPDIFLRRSEASGVTVGPGKLMDFSTPTEAEPASLTTSGGVEYYWYSRPYFGIIPGPKAHSFHLYYKSTVATTVTVTVYMVVQPDGSGTPTLVSTKTYPLGAVSAVTHVKIPDVIVIPETKLNGERIKLGLSSQDPITVYFDGKDTPTVLNYIPPPTTTVGGYVVRISLLAVLAPYLLTVVCLGAASGALMWKRRRV